MKTRIHLPTAVCGLAALLLPGVAGAQPVTLPNPGPSGEMPFTVVAGGSMGGPARAANAVIRDQGELDAFFAPRHAPPVSIDWNSEQLVGVAMGTKNSGGYAVAVEKIERFPGRPASRPVPGGPIGGALLPGTLRILFSQATPAGGPALTVITQPYTLVKMRRTYASDIADFAVAGSSSRNFKLVQLESSIPGFAGIITNTTAISEDGSVTTRQAHPLLDTGPPQSKHGQATADEMRQLEDFVKLAQLAQVPDPLAGSGGYGPSFLLTIKSDDARHEGQTRGMLAGLGSYEAQLRPLLDLVGRIGARVSQQQPSSSAFTKLTRSIFRPSPLMRPLSVDPSIEVLWGTSEEFTIDADGNARFTWSAPNVRTAPIEGKATDAELSKLKDAIQGAALGSIPSQLPRPIHIVAAPSFTLNVEAPVSSNQNTINGELGYYDRYEAQLRPVMDAVDAIIDRLRLPQGDLVRGTVEVRGWWGFRSVWLTGSEDVQVQPWSFARDLIAFEGKTAEVRGDRSGDVITADDLVYPVRSSLRGNVVVRGGDAFIDQPGGQLATFGDAADVLTKAHDAYVTVDAFVFADSDEAYVASVQGESEPGAVFRSFRNPPRGLTPGTVMKLLDLSRSGKSFKVELSDGRVGYVRVDDVDLGPRRLHRPPVHPLRARTGLAGSDALADD